MMRIEPARYFSIYCLSIWAPADYTNFLDHAREILKGQWFGSYSDLTLVKSPFFAIFIAAAAKGDLQDKSVYIFFFEPHLFAIQAADINQGRISTSPFCCSLQRVSLSSFVAAIHS